MKQKIFVALFALALSVLTHGYLTAHYYPLHLGFGLANSLCQVGGQFDCDAVSASSYAALFGIPMAVYGLVYNAILFLMVLMTWLGFRGNSAQSWRGPFWLSTGSLLASFVMGTISFLFLHSLCLFCLIAYGLSVLAFAALWSAQTESPWANLVGDLQDWLTSQRSFLVWLALIPVGAFFVHTGMMQNYGADQLERVIQGAVTDWRSSETINWTSTPALTKGATPENAKLTLTEFADFRCGHCKHAAPSLSAFVKAHPEVRLVFYTFPLDGACNPAFKDGDGISCALARTVYCAGQQNKGWEAHDLIFANQSEFQKLASEEAVLTEVKANMSPLNIDMPALEACIKDPTTQDLIRKQAEQGIAAKVQGTPTIYANGKKLDRGQLLPVLSAVWETIQNSK